MKNNFLFFLTALLVAMGASAQVSVCGVWPDENGHFDCPYIKGGTVTWDDASHTLTLNKAVVEYSSDNLYDGVNLIRVTEDVTIVVQGECKLITTGFVALAFDSYNVKNITLKGNGQLYTSSMWLDIFLVCTRLTIQDITLSVKNGIGNNAEGTCVALTFDKVQATINGGVYRIGEGITFKGCAITYPKDAYVENTGYGYGIYCGDYGSPDQIIISRNRKGDVNGDGEVTVADVNAVINVILGYGSNMNADVNNDGEVTVADVNVIIDIILNPTPVDVHEYVDLGLPSGTLWATCNIGASSPEQYGDYFAWGETAPKNAYNWSNYKWCNGSDNTMTKYCVNNSYGSVDNKTELDPEDDAAYVNWGSSWRMPTNQQLIELIQNCSWEWTSMNDVYGQLGTGPNGKTLFLPASGYRSEVWLYNTGSGACSWSRSLMPDYSNNAFYLDLGSGIVDWNLFPRFYGFTVRAVRVSQN